MLLKAALETDLYLIDGYVWLSQTTPEGRLMTIQLSADQAATLSKELQKMIDVLAPSDVK